MTQIQKYLTVRDRRIQRWALLRVQLQVGRQKHTEGIFPRTASYSGNWSMLVLPKATTLQVKFHFFLFFPSGAINSTFQTDTGMEASLNLRRHFLSRSAQLITPLARYLNTLIPSPSEVKQHARSVSEISSSSSSSTTPTTTPSKAQKNFGLRLKPFNPTNFFASLKTHGSILPFKSTRKKTEFYERYVTRTHLILPCFLLNLCCSGGSSLLLSGHG